jgi:hypothetical protein
MWTSEIETGMSKGRNLDRLNYHHFEVNSLLKKLENPAPERKKEWMQISFSAFWEPGGSAACQAARVTC